MARGVIPRQPSKTGRHSAAKMSRGGSRMPKSSYPHGKARPAKKNSGAIPAKIVTGKFAKVYDPVAPERVREVLKRLDATYPNVQCALHHKSAWELLVATILSAQCTDARVNMVTPLIFAKYPAPVHFASLKPEELEPDIRSTGFFRNKSKSIVGAARKIVNDFGGKVPDTMEELLTVPGAARKTANVVLGSWYHKNIGVVVDTHVHRISRRLELTRNSDPVKIEQDLMKILPQDRWTDFSHQVIHHGRAICTARAPKCADCHLEDICYAADKTWSTVVVHKAAQS